jgi:hypothetical protein
VVVLSGSCLPPALSIAGLPTVSLVKAVDSITVIPDEPSKIYKIGLETSE